MGKKFQVIITGGEHAQIKEQLKRMMDCMSKPKLISNRLLLQKLGLADDTLTSKQVVEKLSHLPTEELQELIDSCEISEEELLQPSLCFDILKSNPFEYIGSESFYDDISDVRLKCMIKYEKNPMMKFKLQKELSTRNSWNGKHRKR